MKAELRLAATPKIAGLPTREALQPDQIAKATKIIENKLDRNYNAGTANEVLQRIDPRTLKFEPTDSANTLSFTGNVTFTPKTGTASSQSVNGLVDLLYGGVTTDGLNVDPFMPKAAKPAMAADSRAPIKLQAAGLSVSSGYGVKPGTLSAVLSGSGLTNAKLQVPFVNLGDGDVRPFAPGSAQAPTLNGAPLADALRQPTADALESALPTLGTTSSSWQASVLSQRMVSGPFAPEVGLDGAKGIAGPQEGGSPVPKGAEA